MHFYSVGYYSTIMEFYGNWSGLKVSVLDSLNQSLAMKKSLHNSTSTLNNQIAQYNADINRLQTAQNKLEDKRNELVALAESLKQPNFTPTNWHGSLANEFDQFRNEQLRSEYLKLVNIRISDVINEIKKKIENLKNLSASAAMKSSSFSLQLDDLNRTISRQREELTT